AILLQLFELTAKHSLYSGVAFHHPHASSGPTKDEVRIEALSGHRVITGARCVIDCQNNLRNRRRCHRFYKLRTGTDDSRVFGLWSNHESGNILNKQQRRLMTVAGLNEV